MTFAEGPTIEERQREVLAHVEALFARRGTPAVGRRAILQAITKDPARVPRSTTESASGIIPMPLQGRMVANESHTVERAYLLTRRRQPELRDIIAQPHLDFQRDFACPDAGCPGLRGGITLDFLDITDDEFIVTECKTLADLDASAKEHPGYVVIDRNTDPVTVTNPTLAAAAEALGIRFQYSISDHLNGIEVQNWDYLERAYVAGPVPDAEAAVVIAAVRPLRVGVLLGELIAGGVAGPEVLQRLIAHGQLFVDRSIHVVRDPDHCPVYLSAAIAAADTHRVTPGWALWRHPAEAVLRRGDRLIWDREAYEVVNAGEPNVTLRLDDDSLWPYNRQEIEGLIRTGSIIIVARETVGEDPGRAIAQGVYARASDSGWATAHRRADLLDRYFADPQRRLPRGMSQASLDRWVARRADWFEQTGDNFVGLFPDERPGNPRDGLPTGIRELADEVIELRYFGDTKRLSQRAILGEIFRVAVERDLWLSPEAQAQRDARARAIADPRAKVDLLTEHPDATGGRAPLSAKTLSEMIKARRTRRNLVQRLGDRLAYTWKPWADVDYEGIQVHTDRSMGVGHLDWTELDLEGVWIDGTNLGRFWMGRYMDVSGEVELGRMVSFESPRGAHTLELLRRVAMKHGTICDITVMDLGAEHRTLDLRLFALRYGKEFRWRPKRAGRAGNAVEGAWWALDLELLYGLAGNTQPTKKVRTMTTATNPKHHARWQLLAFDELMDKYNRVAEARPRSSDGRTRRDAFETGLLVHGRPPADIASDPALMFFTSPSVDHKTVRLRQPEGVPCDGLAYWHPLFGIPALSRRGVARRRILGDVSRLLVRVEGPIDVAAARAANAIAMETPDGDGYGAVLGLPHPDQPDAPARVQHVWVEARCRALLAIRVASFKEVGILSDERPGLRLLRRRGGPAYAYALAKVLAGANATEKSEEARHKAEAVAARRSTPPVPGGQPASRTAPSLDLAVGRPSRADRIRQATRRAGSD